MKKQSLLAIIVGTTLMIIFLAGCTSQYPTSNPPTLTITDPQNGATISGTDLMVMIQVTNFNIVDKQGQAAVSGEGHVHYYLDYDAPTTQGQPAVPPSGVIWQTIASTTYTFHNVNAGSHFVSVELVNNDHTPLNPAVTAKVTVTMTSPSGPTLTLLQPQAGSTITGPNVTVSIQVANFNIVDKQGQPAVTGEGHVHYYLDYNAPTTQGQPAVPPNGTIWQTIASTTYTFHNVTVGSHFVSVELVNNDHTPLNPAVTAKVSFTVSNQSGGGQTYDVYLEAKNIAFNRSTITVPAGVIVMVHFTNDDAGVDHNFAVYTDSYYTNSIFIGSAIAGVSSTTYTFTAPSTPGTYYFRCDYHPQYMTGSFVVT